MLRPLLVLLAIVTPAITVHGQFGRSRDRSGMEPYSAHVIKVGGESWDDQAIMIVAEQLQPRLPDWGQVPAARVEVAFFGHRLHGSTILGLTVWIPESANLRTERQRRDLWNLARLQLEKELQRVAKLAYDAQQERATRELNDRKRERDFKLFNQAAQLTHEVAMLEAETAGTDRESLAKAIAEAVSNQRGLQLESAGIQARREAIEKRIDDLRAIAQEKGDPIVSELKKIVAIREQERRHLETANEKTPGAIAQGQFLEADGRIAEAKIELLRAQREAEDRLSGGALRELNNELSKLLVEAAKVAGQQKQLEQIIAELRKQVVSTAQASATLAPLKDQYNAIGLQRRRVDEEIGRLHRQLSELSEPEILLKPLVEDNSAGEPEASAPGGSEAEDAAPDRP
jgi:hypothetical protein